MTSIWELYWVENGIAFYILMLVVGSKAIFKTVTVKRAVYVQF